MNGVAAWGFTGGGGAAAAAIFDWLSDPNFLGGRTLLVLDFFAQSLNDAGYGIGRGFFVAAFQDTDKPEEMPVQRQ